MAICGVWNERNAPLQDLTPMVIPPWSQHENRQDTERINGTKNMKTETLLDYIDHWHETAPDVTWLRERRGDQFVEWSWRAAQEELYAIATWIEARYGRVHGTESANIALLSRNRAHWMLADLAIIASGNVTVPLFTTLAQDTARYILEFANTRLLILGEAENWPRVSAILRNDVEIITLPGVEIDAPHTRWEDILATHRGQRPAHAPTAGEMISIVFTSGTTGIPKGVMHTHASMLVPMQRCREYFTVRANPRFLSYLPLSHIAERQLVLVQSLIHCGSVTFNESLPTLVRDMVEARPNFFFGPPRVWEQLQQGIIGKFGSAQALQKALEQDLAGVSQRLRHAVGLDEADYMLTGAAPIPPALIAWYDTIGLALMEGFGQTEIMGVTANVPGARRIGSIGRAIAGVEIRIAEDGELLVRSDGAATGYYKMPEKTAETFVDGWVHTGDKARVDSDGFVYLTGRVKDYYKTVHGKFVAPAPIENEFAANNYVEQLCLLGRGYSKTVMLCVLNAAAREQPPDIVANAMRAQAEHVNLNVAKHERIGVVIICRQPWTIENGGMTPTLKLRRDALESRFGEQARDLAQDAATRGELLIHWRD